ncbi:MAG: membrane protein insertion efficiency factor YidD [Bacteroidia bacterium]|nr:membrane protein insertion efficiency factor YidD [Bacteroidia bacterium]
MKLFIILPFLIIINTTLKSQFSSFEKKIILTDTFINTEKNKKDYIFKNSKPLIKYNPIFLIFGGSLYIYQNHISPLIQFGCLYHPSCSEFSKLSIKTYGLLPGTLMTLDRLTRCTRASSVDLHPLFLMENGKFFDHPEIYK